MEVTIKNINTKIEYNQEYKSNGESNVNQALKDCRERRKEALKMALETRKFEIELYWKRAAYFSTFIGLIFTSYFLVAVAEKVELEEKRYELLLIISAIGVFSSFCWFLVNKGSKYWQENWEFHVDLLEDDVMGPLYKTTKKISGKSIRETYDYIKNEFSRKSKKKRTIIKEAIHENNKWKLLSPWMSYKYSVGKINIYLSFLVVFVWSALFFKQICNIKGWTVCSEYNVWFITFVLVISVVFLFMKCKSTGYNGQDKDDNSFTKREIK